MATTTQVGANRILAVAALSGITAAELTSGAGYSDTDTAEMKQAKLAAFLTNSGAQINENLNTILNDTLTTFYATTGIPPAAAVVDFNTVTGVIDLKSDRIANDLPLISQRITASFVNMMALTVMRTEHAMNVMDSAR